MRSIMRVRSGWGMPVAAAAAAVAEAEAGVAPEDEAPAASVLLADVSAVLLVAPSAADAAAENTLGAPLEAPRPSAEPCSPVAVLRC